jgi:hypothetical protein
MRTSSLNEAVQRELLYFVPVWRGQAFRTGSRQEFSTE